MIACVAFITSEKCYNPSILQAFYAFFFAIFTKKIPAFFGNAGKSSFFIATEISANPVW